MFRTASSSPPSAVPFPSPPTPWKAAPRARCQCLTCNGCAWTRRAWVRWWWRPRRTLAAGQLRVRLELPLRAAAPAFPDAVGAGGWHGPGGEQDDRPPDGRLAACCRGWRSGRSCPSSSCREESPRWSTSRHARGARHAMAERPGGAAASDDGRAHQRGGGADRGAAGGRPARPWRTRTTRVGTRACNWATWVRASRWAARRGCSCASARTWAPCPTWTRATSWAMSCDWAPR